MPFFSATLIEAMLSDAMIGDFELRRAFHDLRQQSTAPDERPVLFVYHRPEPELASCIGRTTSFDLSNNDLARPRPAEEPHRVFIGVDRCERVDVCRNELTQKQPRRLEDRRHWEPLSRRPALCTVQHPAPCTRHP